MPGVALGALPLKKQQPQMLPDTHCQSYHWLPILLLRSASTPDSATAMTGWHSGIPCLFVATPLQLSMLR